MKFFAKLLSFICVFYLVRGAPCDVNTCSSDEDGSAVCVYWSVGVAEGSSCYCSIGFDTSTDEPNVCKNPCKDVACVGDFVCQGLYDGTGGHVCVCPSGKIIVRGNCVDSDPCAASTCNDGDDTSAGCVPNAAANDYSCNCSVGYETSYEEPKVCKNPCKDEVCEGNFVCQGLFDGSGGLVCVCPFDKVLVGGNCVASDPCATSTCNDGDDTSAGCVPNAAADDYSCNCSVGYEVTGDSKVCKNPCTDSSCEGDLVCQGLFDGSGGSVCVCPSGKVMVGTNCVASDPCDGNPCDVDGDNDAICIPTANGLDYTCRCSALYDESDSDQRCVDPCESHSCRDDQICVGDFNKTGAHTCDCPGDELEYNGACVATDKCESNPCGANGTCYSTVGSTSGYVCQCDSTYVYIGGTCSDPCVSCSGDGYTSNCFGNPGSYGFECECNATHSHPSGDLTTCEANPCVDNPCGTRSSVYTGECKTLTFETYECVCQDGYVHANDDLTKCYEDVCTSSVCTGVAHAGCVVDATTGVAEYSCLCAPGNIYSSDSTQSCRVSSCTTDICKDVANSTGECVDVSDTEYECECNAAFWHVNGDYKTCELMETDPCEDNPCQSTANSLTTCIRRFVATGESLSYECPCKSGYSHPEDDYTTCKDTDECTTNPCSPHTCGNTVGSYECTCNTGFVHAIGHTQTCIVDVCQDACLTEGTSGVCTIHPNNVDAVCTCDDGYQHISTDTLLCFDIDECETIVCTNGSCVNTSGSYSCECNSGYEVDADNKNVCKDIDECTTNTHKCPTDATCVNSDGAYTCNCPAGQVLNANMACVASLCTEGVCDKSYGLLTGDCVDKPSVDGSDVDYSCNCAVGYYPYHADQHRCIRGPCAGSDMCLSSTSLNGTCNDLSEDEYECECNAGYVHAGGSLTTCVEDPCAGTPCVASDSLLGECVPLSDASYECTCKEGYDHFLNDLTVCQKDMCNTVSGGVSTPNTCVGSGNQCGIRCDTALHTKECTMQSGVATCTCLSGYEHSTGSTNHCVDTDECSEGVNGMTACPQSVATCVNTPGSYECLCDESSSINPLYFSLKSTGCSECCVEPVTEPVTQPPNNTTGSAKGGVAFVSYAFVALAVLLS